MSRFLNGHMVDTFADCGDMLATYPVVGIYRHAESYMGGKPGMFRVIVCIEGVDSFDAVMDDFGNLVRVQ